MSGSLIAVFCVADVSAETLSRIWRRHTAGSPDTPPSLVVLDSSTIGAYVAPSRPPLSLSRRAFLSNSTADIAYFLDTNADGKGIAATFFLVADERTKEDESVLCVCRAPRAIKSVRLAPQSANGVPVALSVGSLGIEEIQAIVDGEGVYRGTQSPPQRGGPAPRRKL